jgi:hypothetical protein
VKISIPAPISTGIHKLLSTLLAVAISISLCLAILVHSLLSTFSDLSSYDLVFERTRLVDRSQGLIIRYIISPALQGGSGEGYAYLDLLRDIPMETWEKMARSILPPQWLEANSRSILHAILAWMDTDGQSLPEITLDLSPLIEVLRSPKGSLAVLSIIQQIPACPPGVRPKVTNQIETVPCLTEEHNIVMMAELTAQVAADSLPASVTTTGLQGMGLIDPAITSMIEKVHTSTRLAQAGEDFFLRLCLLLLALYGLLHSSSLKGFLKSLPSPAYISGIGLLLIIALGYGALQFGSTSIMTVILSAIDIRMQALLADIVRTSGDLLLRGLAGWSLLLLGSGLATSLAFYIVSRWMKWRDTRKELSSKAVVRIRKQFR